jgi:predicted RNase H-like HicB family nuclease
MPDEFSYTFRNHNILLTRDEVDRNWYVQVIAPTGCYACDGYWLNSAGKTLKEALQYAKEGAMLVKPLGVPEDGNG